MGTIVHLTVSADGSAFFDGLSVDNPPGSSTSREFQARADEELVSLPEGSAVAEMVSDYAVMGEQARACF